MCTPQVIAKGVPEEAMPGIAERQVPLPDSLLNFNGLYNSQGSKVGCSRRLGFVSISTWDMWCHTRVTSGM